MRRAGDVVFPYFDSSLELDANALGSPLPLLLGHKSERMTTHYSAPDISRLIEAAESVCTRRANTILRISHTNLTQSALPAKTVQEGRA